jgi:hypothetical protein|tara:strand:+ start:15 stop:269 length:255 start_codon:yes stop_codon:yes gene_type:complete
MYNTVEREDFNVKIEKNIPMPKARDMDGGKYKIVDEMEVGDSVLVENCDIQSMRHRARNKNAEKRFASRQDGKNSTHTRLWRVE